MELENAIGRVADTAPLSLLYPSGIENTPNMKNSGKAISDLGLDAYFDLKISSAAELLSCDAEVLKYREASVRDLMAVPDALDVLKKSVPIMSDITDLRRLGSEADSADEYIYNITEIELYISLLDLLESDFLPFRDKFTSPALTLLCERAEALTSSDGAKEIRRSLAELSGRVREIGCVTIGVNLDSRLFPESAGLLSVAPGKFKSGQTLDRILHLDFKQDEKTFAAPLASVSKLLSDSENEGLRSSVMSALGAVFKSSFKSWKRIIKTYVLENTDFLLGMLPDIEFMTCAVTFLKKLEERGVTLAYPVINEEGRALSAKGLVNPVIALATDGKLVPNDFAFDADAGIFVVTGPNRGGKSVFTSAVGQAVVMAQLGLPVAADSFELSLCDNIFCHFPNGDDTIDRGRLGEECARLSEIVSKVSPRSLVLLDESLSSTGSYEATSIAEEIISALAVLGCRTLFSTHLHTLAADVDLINARVSGRGGVKVDNLVARTEGKERTFKIVRAKPEGKSYASDIAEKYGLSMDEIIKKVKTDE